MDIFAEGKGQYKRFRTTKAFPRKYSIFTSLFQTYLNITSCQAMPNLEWFIEEFEKLLDSELDSAFANDRKYLVDMHKKYDPEKY